jgi:HPr kinase/phosphorylase
MTALKIRDILRGARTTLGIKQITGKAGLMRTVDDTRVQRYVGEDGFWDRLIPKVILIINSIGVSELAATSSESKKKIFQSIISSRIPCVAIANSDSPNDFMVSFSENYSIPLFTSMYDGFFLESRLLGLMREKIDNAVSMHGALVNIFGSGVIITGDSGAGKTQCACELVKRGHAWIADDVIEIEKRGNILYGRSHNLIKQLIDIKDKGIVDAKEFLGDEVIRDETTIDIIIDLKKMNHMKVREADYPAGRMRNIMGVQLPNVQLRGYPYTGDLCRYIECAVHTYLMGRGNV